MEYPLVIRLMLIYSIRSRGFQYVFIMQAWKIEKD